MQSRHIVAALAVMMVAGCGSVRHAGQYDREFVPMQGMKVEVGPVVNTTGRSFEADIVPLFRNALSADLSDADLLWSATSTTGHLVLSTKILEYEPGCSLTRWLVPGWGTAALTVHCEMKDSETHTFVGSIDARRTISIGRFAGWRVIMADVGADVAGELKRKLHGK